ncbi:MAG: AAA family ATPase [Halieaceae bacterium]|jgi:predicted kinase|nr:AAA family ATPase [Halieaceae bacterium]
MVKHRLMLIEGLPGTGKTTLARHLQQCLQEDGQSVECLLENDKPHPLHPPWHSDPQQMADAFVACWREHLQGRLSQERTVIADAAIFQTVARILLLQNFPDALIDQCLLEISCNIEALNPLLLYVRTADSDAHIRSLCEQRGDDWRSFLVQASTENRYAASQGYRGFTGMLQFIVDYQRRSEHWFDFWPLDKHSLYHRGDWEMLYSEVYSKLGFQR